MTWYQKMFLIIFMISTIFSCYQLGSAVKILTSRIEILETELATMRKANIQMSNKIQKNYNTMYEMFTDYWKESTAVNQDSEVE